MRILVVKIVGTFHVGGGGLLIYSRSVGCVTAAVCGDRPRCRDVTTLVEGGVAGMVSWPRPCHLAVIDLLVVLL